MNAHTTLVRSIMKALPVLGVHPMKRGAGKLKIDPGRWFHGNEAGTPDIEVMLRNQRVIWLEAKTGTGKLSKSQVAWRGRAKRMGHRVVVVRCLSDAIDAVEAALTEGSCSK